MSIKKAPVFPHDPDGYEGIDYKDWLIGQIAAGQSIVNMSSHHVEFLAGQVAEFANEIIKKLDDE